VLLSAELGIGKSRLTEALAERVGDKPHIRLRYFCSPHHQDSALYPIIGQLEHAAGFARDDAPSHKAEKLAALIGAGNDRALLADLLSLPSGGDTIQRSCCRPITVPGRPGSFAASSRTRRSTLKREWRSTTASVIPIIAMSILVTTRASVA